MTSPLSDLDALFALPRLAGLALSPDGTRLVTAVSTLRSDRTKYVTALWEIDPTGGAPARRLTRSRKGEAAPVFAADGALLFTSARPDPDDDDDGEPADDAPAALWLLPPHGEARLVASRPGGLGTVRAASNAATVVALAPTMPGAADGDDDATRRARRKDAKARGILHAGYPVRHWDADLGPAEPRLLAVEPREPGEPGGPGDGRAPGEPGEAQRGDGAPAWRDLTPSPGRALDDAGLDVSPDGATAVATWSLAEPRGSRRSILVAVDTRTGERRTLADDGTSDHDAPRISPDGRSVAVLRRRRSSPVQPVDVDLLVLALDGSGEPAVLTADWDRWPEEVQWCPDSAALIVTADEGGARPVFRIDRAGGPVNRLSGDRGHYADLQVSPDGTTLYALRDAVDAPPAPVRFDARAADQQPTWLRGPANALALPGALTEVEATADDGTSLRGWLVLPEGDGPHPLLLWAHGGPLASWNSWSWRWQPWRLAAKGYAVLLPDPALSTGYGMAMLRRGWGDWGGAPYRDLMTLTDAALRRDDLDEARTAMMGGSYGGYLANWIAGHTDRFRAIVTHASLWDLTQFAGTTDVSYYWLREMTPETARRSSPSAHADAIRTPMLVVHGDRDYRVPVGEGLRLWWDLVSHCDEVDLPHRFLLFPDEGHWILSPQNAKTWYETVEAFLAWHVLGEPWQTPDVLR